MKEELKNWFQIDLDTIEEDKELFANIQKAIEKLNDIEMANKYEIVLNNNLIEVKDKYTNFRTILGCRVSYDNLDKNISFIVRKDNKPTYEELEDKINKQKEVLNRLKVVYTSMQFSAPENIYIFIEQMGDLLEEIE